MPADLRLTTEPLLPQYTDQVRRGDQIAWYRSPLSRDDFKRMHERDDTRAWIQTAGYLAILTTTGTAVLLSAGRSPWQVTLALVFLHGTVSSFMINAVHELGHGTVFKGRRRNEGFCAVFAFLGFLNHPMFQASHVRHHPYTLHPPEDLEVVLPIRLMVSHFLARAFFNWPDFVFLVRTTVRVADGRFHGEWEKTLYPDNEPERHRAAVRWARVLLVGHASVLAIAVLTGLWLLPVVVTLGSFIGGALFWLCNNTQHVGLCDNVSDFRLCTRSLLLTPAVRFLYWQMNYHIEHHMYAAVPCYRLGELHRLIQHDLPPTPRGLIAVWREIITILRRQRSEPDYQYRPVLPGKALATG